MLRDLVRFYKILFDVVWFCTISCENVRTCAKMYDNLRRRLADGIATAAQTFCFTAFVCRRPPNSLVCKVWRSAALKHSGRHQTPGTRIPSASSRIIHTILAICQQHPHDMLVTGGVLIWESQTIPNQQSHQV